MTWIAPHDQLPEGTPVQIGDKRGTVTTCAYVPASNGGMIAVHTVLLTERFDRQARPRRWTAITPTLWTGNYTAVQVRT